MPQGVGADALQADTEKLLATYRLYRQESAEAAQSAVAQFLMSLPPWVHATEHAETLKTIGRRFYMHVNALMHDNVNSAAAMEIRQYTGNCMYYPFLVLMEATAQATSLPAIFCKIVLEL